MEVARLVSIDLQLESLRQHVGSDPLPLRFDRLLAGGDERAPSGLGKFGKSVRRQIVKQPLTGETHVDGGQGTQRGDLADEVVGNLVDAHPVRR